MIRATVMKLCIKLIERCIVIHQTESRMVGYQVGKEDRGMHYVIELRMRLVVEKDAVCMDNDMESF